MKKVNLYNVDKSVNRKKTRNVIRYIGKLELLSGSDHNDILKFDRIKKEALSLSSPDDMLDKIGFKVDGLDEIFSKCKVHPK